MYRLFSRLFSQGSILAPRPLTRDAHILSFGLGAPKPVPTCQISEGKERTELLDNHYLLNFGRVNQMGVEMSVFI